jgi:chemotaxis protein methyltransferase CheR
VTPGEAPSSAPAAPGRGDDAPALDPGEVGRLLDHLFVHTGVDFRRYARRAVERRLRHVMAQDGLGRLTELQARCRDGAAAMRLAERMCVKVTTLFRDPPFWAALRSRVASELAALPLVRVWVAGCSTGEEAYSTAIVLAEEGLYARSRIYATDVDESALERARAGSYPLEHMREYTQNYLRAGGAAAFSEHYVVRPHGAVLKESLRRNIVFARHNLLTDAAFNHFHVVLCRNVLIYFERAVQDEVHALLLRSLARGGVLGLGQREIVPPRLARGVYDELDRALKLYRRVGWIGDVLGSSGA